jgi:drug/metabolite transporter (DMT)-like permease
MVLEVLKAECQVRRGQPAAYCPPAVDKLRFIVWCSLNISFAGSRVIGDPRTWAVESDLVTESKNKAAILTEISLILAAIFWGTKYAATKFAALSIPPLSIVALRFVVGGLLMYAILRILEPGSRPGRKDLLSMAGLGCFGVVVAQTSFTFGVSMTTAANTGLIFATAPVWRLLLGLERPTWGGMVGVALSILGVAIVFWEGLTGAGGGDLGGDLLVLLAALGVGSYTVLSMPLLERHSPLAVATYPIVFGGRSSWCCPFRSSRDWSGRVWEWERGRQWASQSSSPPPSPSRRGRPGSAASEPIGCSCIST